MIEQRGIQCLAHTAKRNCELNHWPCSSRMAVLPTDLPLSLSGMFLFTSVWLINLQSLTARWDQTGEESLLFPHWTVRKWKNTVTTANAHRGQQWHTHDSPVPASVQTVLIFIILFAQPVFDWTCHCYCGTAPKVPNARNANDAAMFHISFYVSSWENHSGGKRRVVQRDEWSEGDSVTSFEFAWQAALWIWCAIKTND